MALRAVFGRSKRFAVLCGLDGVTDVAVSALEVRFMRSCLGLSQGEEFHSHMTAVAPKGLSSVQWLFWDILPLLAPGFHLSEVLGTAAQQRAHIVNIVHSQTAVFFNELDILLGFCVKRSEGMFILNLAEVLLDLGELFAELSELLRDALLPLAHETIIPRAVAGHARLRCGNRGRGCTALMAPCADHP